MEKQLAPPDRYKVVRGAQSFSYAWRGLFVFFKSTPNAWIQLGILACVVFAGISVRITSVDWMCIVLASGFVLAAEAFNTAIEIDIDLTSPTYHPYARDTKDVAAGAVLIASITAVIIGLFIFVPYIFHA